MRGEFDKAQVSFDAARADGGESAVDPEVALFGLAMKRGDADAAAQHLATLKGLANAEQLTLDNYLQIGDALVAGIYIFFGLLQIWMFAWWQKRGQVRPTTELVTSTYGRPLVRRG